VKQVVSMLTPGSFQYFINRYSTSI